MPRSTPSASSTMSFDTVLVRLSGRELVAGLITIGSTAQDTHGAWFGAYYNLHHNRRLLRSDDPLHLLALDLRLLYSLFDVLTAYFLVRGLRWEGEKAAVRYLQTAHPAFLDLLRLCLTEGDRAQRMRLYEHLIDLCMAPVGDRLDEGMTSITLDPASSASPADIDTGLHFWNRLLGD